MARQQRIATAPTCCRNSIFMRIFPDMASRALRRSFSLSSFSNRFSYCHGKIRGNRVPCVSRVKAKTGNAGDRKLQPTYDYEGANAGKTRAMAHLPEVLDDFLLLSRREQGGWSRTPLYLVEVVPLELVKSLPLYTVPR